MRKTIRRNRCGPYRRYGFTALRIVLGALAAVMLFLAGAAVVRSVRTARLNSRLSELHDASGEETDPQNSQTHNLPGAGTAGQAPTRGKITGRPSLMGCPDGSAIREYGETALLSGGESNTVFHKAGPENAVLKEMQNLKRINRDTVGWIQIGKVLDLPVVYRDNSWYLNHDFYGNRNGSGTLFLDAGHPLESGTQNLLIHGHNMKDGSMFAMLTHYTSEKFLRDHSLITFSTLWEKEIYQVFAVLRVSSVTDSPNYFNFFGHPTFPEEADFTAYIRELRRRAVRSVDMRIDPKKPLLTLSTCEGDDRIVVVAERIL